MVGAISRMRMMLCSPLFFYRFVDSLLRPYIFWDAETRHRRLGANGVNCLMSNLIDAVSFENLDYEMQKSVDWLNCA
jgi:hypothetical protein